MTEQAHRTWPAFGTRVLAALVILYACLLALAPPAAAHVRIETDPATGTRHAVGPSQIRVKLSEPVHSDQLHVTLRRYRGPEQALKVDRDGRTAKREYTAPISHKLKRSNYMIEVTVTADGHLMRYRTYFVVGPDPLIKQGVGGADTANRASETLNRTGSPLGLVALVGIGLLFTATLTGATRTMLALAARTARFCIWFGVTAVILQLAAVVMARDGQLEAVYGTQVGRLLLLQLATFGAVSWTAERLTVVPAMSHRRATLENTLAVTGLVLVLAYAGRSHAAGDEWSFMSLTVAMVHLSSVSLWISGLLALTTLTYRETLCDVPPVTLRRFGRLARSCSCLALLSGAFLAFRLTDGFDFTALRSAYGVALMGKGVMVCIFAFCAWRTHQAIDTASDAHTSSPPATPSIGSGADGVLTVPPGTHAPGSAQPLRKRVLTQSGSALAVLISANVLAVWAR